MLFSTGILFSQVFVLGSIFGKIQGHFLDMENEFVIFQVFYNTWEPDYL